MNCKCKSCGSVFQIGIEQHVTCPYCDKILFISDDEMNLAKQDNDYVIFDNIQSSDEIVNEYLQGKFDTSNRGALQEKQTAFQKKQSDTITLLTLIVIVAVIAILYIRYSEPKKNDPDPPWSKSINKDATQHLWKINANAGIYEWKIIEHDRAYDSYMEIRYKSAPGESWSYTKHYLYRD